MYSLHFYAATHGEEFRIMTEELSGKGLPIFATEFGITTSGGGSPIDIGSADEWIALLERERISYCMWAFSNVPEACSAVRSGVHKYSGYEREDFTETGLWLMDTLAKYDSK